MKEGCIYRYRGHLSNQSPAALPDLLALLPAVPMVVAFLSDGDDDLISLSLSIKKDLWIFLQLPFLLKLQRSY